jgi:Protein RETICULATA-related
MMLLSPVHILACILTLSLAFPPKICVTASSISSTCVRGRPGNEIPSLDSVPSDPSNIVGNSIAGSRLLDMRGGGGGGALEQLIKGFRARVAYDSSFMTKITVELIVGFTTQVAAEIAKRGANSLAELDFIIAE